MVLGPLLRHALINKEITPALGTFQSPTGISGFLEDFFGFWSHHITATVNAIIVSAISQRPKMFWLGPIAWGGA
jgi:hypothetical protein